MEILRDVALPALREMEIRPLVDPDTGAVVVPYQTRAGGKFLLEITASDDLQEAMLYTVLADVPEARLNRVARLLCRLNAHYKFVTFSLQDGEARLDICIEL